MKGGVLRAKDRFDPEKMPFGYRYLLVNVMCPGTSVVCEVQFYHKIFYDSKKDSHCVYKRKRLFDVGERNLAYEYVTDHIKSKIPHKQKYVSCKLYFNATFFFSPFAKSNQINLLIDVCDQTKKISRFNKDDDDDHGKKEVTVSSLLKEWFTDKNDEDGVAGITEDCKTVSYLQILVDQGYDKVEGLKDLNDDDLKEMKFKPETITSNLWKIKKNKKKKKKRLKKKRKRLYRQKPADEKKEQIEEDNSGLRETKNYNGGGCIYLVDIASPHKYTCIREDGYVNGQSMCRISNEKLYICAGTSFGAKGDSMYIFLHCSNKEGKVTYFFSIKKSNN
ncbi:TRAP-related protein [Reticulomyxa filosa]|uniref:TRAP-related protein n=1 Tax=Reticulomyxa filosa TaxID=46433 RepID=X6M2S2_RETFI|nr:TRAP-related protein [Reticulomyxa filosa]|eukprot:ETO07747.1 TRAP-related protein [Reticulomyxa filosa]